MTATMAQLAEIEARRAHRADEDLDSAIARRWAAASRRERARLLTREVFFDAKWRRSYGR